MDYYDFDDKLDTRCFKVEALPDLWHCFDTNKYSYVFDLNNWKDFKFLKEDGSLNEGISSLDNTRGGIYVFYINPNIIPSIHRYIVYIGRVQKTTRQNMRKRLQEYFRDYVVNANSSRYDRNVYKIFRFWKNYIHVKCLFLGDSNGSDNVKIRELEEELIKVIRPFYNDDIPKVTHLPIKTGTEVFG